MKLDKNTCALLVIDAIEAVGDDSLYDPDAATAAYRGGPTPTSWAMTPSW